MIINHTNASATDNTELYHLVHDSQCVGFDYHFFENKIVIELLSEDGSRKYSIVFENVFALQMLSCDFWVYSPGVYDWKIASREERSLTDEITGYMKSHHIDSCRFPSSEASVQSKMYFKSGNVLDVVCETIRVTECTAE